GVSRRNKKVTLASNLDQIAGIHDRNLVRNLRDHCEVVGDKKHGKVKLVLQLGEQLQNLRLDANVERGCGFIRDEELRTIGDGHCDHDALPHSAGKLVRIIAGATLG